MPESLIPYKETKLVMPKTTVRTNKTISEQDIEDMKKAAKTVNDLLEISEVDKMVIAACLTDDGYYICYSQDQSRNEEPLYKEAQLYGKKISFVIYTNFNLMNYSKKFFLVNESLDALKKLRLYYKLQKDHLSRTECMVIPEWLKMRPSHSSHSEPSSAAPKIETQYSSRSAPDLNESQVLSEDSEDSDHSSHVVKKNGTGKAHTSDLCSDGSEHGSSHECQS